MYTYEITGEPPISRILYDDVVIDVVGPWASTEAAETWASAYVNGKNMNVV